MIKPLQIYLDTSDYSHISNPNSPLYEKYQKTREALKYYIDEKYIEIRFSYIHVLEIIHAKIDYKGAALRRADAMLDLCGNKVLVDFQTLQFLDAKCLLQQQSKKSDTMQFPYYAYSNDGDWLPSFKELKLEIKDTINEQLKETLKETGQSRNQRRKAKKLIMNRYGLNRELLPLIELQSEQIHQQLMEKFPLTEGFYKEKIVLKFLLNEITETEFTHELQKGMQDVRNFVRCYFDRYFAGDKNPYTGLIKHSSRNLENIENMRKDIMLTIDNNSEAQDYYIKNFKKIVDKNSQKIISGINASRSNQLERMLPEYRKWDKNPNISERFWNEIVVNSQIGQLPNLDSFISILTNYFINSIRLDGKNNTFPKIKPSDWGDIRHACYLPYVTIFRSDSSFSKNINEVASKYGTIVIHKIDDLVPRIKELVSNRPKIENPSRISVNAGSNGVF